MAQCALRTPSPLLLRRERVRWWGTAVGSAPEAIDTVVSREEAADADAGAALGLGLGRGPKREAAIMY